MLRSLIAAAFLFAGCVSPARAEEPPLAEQIVDALNKADGAYPGFRANHAKGLVAQGHFRPTAEAAKLSRAAIFKGPAVPVTIRFSSGSGIPNVQDGSPRANPHGFSAKFHLRDGSETDIVTNARKFFPVATGEEFRDLELAVAASVGAPKPTPLDRFIETHPLVAIPLETPASLAQEQYNGLNTFILVNATGIRQPVRYQIVPPQVVHLTREQAAQRSANFLFDDIRARIAAAPVHFELRAVLPEAGDPLNDATKIWPPERRVVTLGSFVVEKVAPDSDEAQKALLFLPGNVTDGIEASDDPLIAARDDSYAVSFSRRMQ